MAVTKSVFGKSPEGREISLYTLSNSKGMQAKGNRSRCESGRNPGTGCARCDS